MIGELMCTRGCMVTDCELAFRKAIKKYLPGMPLFRCWNHFFNSTETWVKKHNGKKEDVQFYNDSLRQILLQNSLDHAEKLISRSKKGYITAQGQDIPPWSQTFVDYFDDEIYPELEALAAFSI